MRRLNWCRWLYFDWFYSPPDRQGVLYTATCACEIILYCHLKFLYWRHICFKSNSSRRAREGCGHNSEYLRSDNMSPQSSFATGTKVSVNIHRKVQFAIISFLITQISIVTGIRWKRRLWAAHHLGREYCFRYHIISDHDFTNKT